MNFEFFLARRMRTSATNEITVSRRIIKIAILAIALGMVMMLIAIGTSLGLQKEIKAKTTALSGDIRIAPFENNNSSLSVTPIDTTEMNFSSWVNRSKIDHFYTFINKGTLLKKGKEFEGAIVKGVDSAFPWEKLKTYLIAGVFPKFDSTVSKEILLSQTLARQLKLNLGDRVTAHFEGKKEGSLPMKRYWTVVGIYQTGFPDFDNNFVFADLRQLQKLNHWRKEQIGGVELFVTDKNNLKNDAHLIYNSLPPHIDVQTVDQIHQSVFDWIALFDFNVLIILIIMILVGTLNMATALLVLILERSRMIGILKAIGTTNNQIQRIFLLNAAYIISHGLFWGNTVGLMVLFFQNKWGWISLDPATYFVSILPIHLPLLTVVGLNVLVLLICLSILWIPSLIVSRVDPAQVLRFR